MSYGAQVKLGIARQAAEGTAVVAAGSFHPFAFLNEDVGLEKQELISANITGKFEQGATYSGVSNVAGTIEFELTPRSLMAALAAAVNYNPAIVTSGSVKTMTFLPNTVDYSATAVKAPFTVYKQWTDASSAESFYDCEFGGLELTIAQQAFTKAKANVVGGARSTNGVGSLSIVPDGQELKTLFPWSVASISYGGAAVQNYSTITVKLNENIAPLYTINGTLSPFKFTRTNFREVTVNGTFYMTDRTLLNNFANETQARLLITLISTLTTIQSGYYHTLTIDVPQLKITAFKPANSGPGEVSVPVTGRGTLDASSNYAIQFVLTNTYGTTL